MYWTTKEGKSIKITEMDDEHLKNTIVMLADRDHDIPIKMYREFKERCRSNIIDEKFLKYVNEKVFEIMIEDYLDRQSWDRGYIEYV